LNFLLFNFFDSFQKIETIFKKWLKITKEKEIEEVRREKYNKESNF
jgi:hypothetical protein